MQISLKNYNPNILVKYGCQELPHRADNQGNRIVVAWAAGLATLGLVGTLIATGAGALPFWAFSPLLGVFPLGIALIILTAASLYLTLKMIRDANIQASSLAG